VTVEPLHPVYEMEELPAVDINKPRGTRNRKAMHTDVRWCYYYVPSLG